MKLGTRLITYLVVTLIVVMSAHTLINIIQSSRDLRDEIRRSAEKVAEIVAGGARSHLQTGEAERLNRLLSILGRLEGVLDLVVHSADGKILGRFHVPTEKPPRQPEIENPGQIPAAGLGRAIRWGRLNAFEYILPVRPASGPPDAFVHVVMDLSSVEHHSAKSRRINILTIGAMTALLAVLFFFFIRHSVVFPLEELTRAVGTFRQGKWNHRLKVTKEDELGDLASEFNIMAEEIEKANRRLILEHEHQRAIFHSLREGVIVLDRSNRVVSWNPAALALAGMPEGEDASAFLMRFIEGTGEHLFAALEEISQGKREEVLLPPFECVCREGRIRRVRANVRKLMEGPMAGGIVVVIEDVTEQETLSQQVMRAERLASLGQLASGLAHEIGTPLNVVSGRVQQALARLNSGHPAREKLSPIVGQIDRITGLVRRLLEFARGGQIQPREVDLNREIREVLDLVETTRERAGVALDLSLADPLPSLHADAGQMQQLVLNLCVNALQAMPEGGRLRISTAEREGEVLLEVADTGSGIPESDLSRVFDPFFTTKDIEEGTGLGLTVCHRIVEDHGGRIEVLSPPGEGATFRVRFPFRAKGAPREQSIA